MQNKILQFLITLLGEDRKTSGDNHAFHCPTCKHRKKKLEVDVKRGYWHCWVCDEGSKSLFSLLKWIKAPKDKYQELSKILDRPIKYDDTSEDTTDAHLELPKEFIPMWEVNPNNFYWNAAMNYLKGRGLTPKHMLKYGVGYCTTGEYEQMVIIPSYDRDGNLNYFSSRAFMDNKYIKFKNPPVGKDVVGFELMINWDEPVILVESVFDAIAVRHNAIPLYGKTIMASVRKAIFDNNVQELIICLDADAMDTAISHAEEFVGYDIDVKVVTLPEDHDPSSLGHEKVWEYIHNSTSINKSSLLEWVVKDHLYGKGKTDLPHRRHSLPFVSSSR